MKAAVALAATYVVLGLIACTHDDPVAPSTKTLKPAYDLFIEPPGEGGHLCFAYLDDRPAFGGIWWQGPTGPLCRTVLHGPPPGIFEDPYAQPHNVVAEFSEPVSNLVISAYAVWACGSDPGTVTLYTAAGESVTLPMPHADDSHCGERVEIFPGAECGDYYMQPSAPAQSMAFDVPDVVRVVISPPSPLFYHWTFYRANGTGCGFDSIDMETAVYTQYIVAFREFDLQNQELVVACDPTAPVRGQETTCTARTEPGGGALQVTAWRFVANDASLGVIERDAAEASQTSWSGPIAATGSVVVEGAVGGVHKQASATLSVIARSWAQEQTQLEPIDASQTCSSALPLHPTQDHDFGDVGFDPNFTADFFEIQSGLNRGLFYFTKIPIVVQATVRINCAALTKGSDFWRLQPAFVPPLAMGTPHCTQADVVAALPLVRAHEGVSRSDPNSHVQTYMDELDKQARPFFEPEVGVAARPKNFLAEIGRMGTQAITVSRQITDGSSRNPFRLSCSPFNYFPPPSGP